VAAVVLKPSVSLTVKEIRDHCKHHLLDWKCPREVIFLKELPRNRMGKILKEEVSKILLTPFPLTRQLLLPTPFAEKLFIDLDINDKKDKKRLTLVTEYNTYLDEIEFMRILCLMK